MPATTPTSVAASTSLRHNVQHCSMYRKMQSVLRDTADVFRWSTVRTGKYLQLDSAEAQLNLAYDEFLLSLNDFVTGAPEECPITISRSEQQWEDVVSAQFKLAFVTAKGEKEKTRQNVIHELFLREMNLCYDILLMMHLYQRPLMDFGLLSAQESAALFPNISQLFAAHFHFVRQLLGARNEDGVYSGSVGRLILEQIDRLCEPYETYLLRLKESQKVLKKKLKCRRFVHFLQSSVVQQFSRRLPLATFIDSPRSLLMKLSIVFAEIQKCTEDADDQAHLERAVELMKWKVKLLNDAIQSQEFQQFVARFWIAEESVEEVFNGSTAIILRSGVRRKNSRLNRGKPQLILFNQVLILARRSFRAQRYYSIARIATDPNVKSDLYYDFGKSKGALQAELNTLHFQKHLNSKCQALGSSNSSTSLRRRLKRRQLQKSTPPSSTTSTRRSSLRGGCIAESTTLHLFSLEVNFNICIHFRSIHDLRQWMCKLAAYFELKQSSASSVKGKLPAGENKCQQGKRILLAVDDG